MVEFKKLDVLVLDDEAFVTNILLDMLKEIGVGKSWAFNSAEEADNALFNCKPNIILSDINLGQMCGFDFVDNARRKHQHVNQAAVLFLSGYSDPEFIQKAKARRVAGYLLKPIEPVKLKASFAKIYSSLLTSGRL